MEKPKLTSDNKVLRELYRLTAKELLGAELQILQSEASTKSKEIDEWLSMRLLAVAHLQRFIRLSRLLGMKDDKIRAFLRDYDVESVPDNEADLPTTSLQ